MSTKGTIIVVLFLIVLAWGAGIAVQGSLPEKVAIHWNEKGEANGYDSVAFGIHFTPAITLGIVLLCLGIPLIDPLRKNIEAFRPSYNLFIVVLTFYMVYIHGLTLVWNLGYHINMGQALAPAFAGLFYMAGVLIGKARQNYMIGIRTPWTLANPVVWDKTHALGAWLFKGVAGFSLLGLFFPDAFFLFLMGSIMAAVLVLFVYSYIIFRQETVK